MNRSAFPFLLCFGILVSSLAICCPKVEAGWPRIKVLGGRSLGEAIGNGSKGPILFPRVEQERSHFAVTSPGYIDQHGRVWSGQANSGSRRHVIGKASLERRGNSFYWVTSLKSYGAIKPRYKGPVKPLFPNQQKNSDSLSGSPLFSNSKVSPQRQSQQRQQQAMNELQRLQQMERQMMQQATQNMMNGINRAFQQNQRNW